MSAIEDLGLAILIARAESGDAEPVAVVATMEEASETSAEDMDRRMDEIENGGNPMCPVKYELWARDAAGTYRACRVIPI